MQTNIKTKLISPERYLQVWKAVNKQLSRSLENNYLNEYLNMQVFGGENNF